MATSDTQNSNSQISSSGRNKESTLERKKKSTKDQIQKYFTMLTTGCGDTSCTNSAHCSTANPGVKLTPNEAVVKAVTLAKTKAPICAKLKTKLKPNANNTFTTSEQSNEVPMDVSTASSTTMQSSNARNSATNIIPQEINFTRTTSAPPTTALSNTTTTNIDNSIGDTSTHRIQQHGRWLLYDTTTTTQTSDAMDIDNNTLTNNNSNAITTITGNNNNNNNNNNNDNIAATSSSSSTDVNEDFHLHENIQLQYLLAQTYYSGTQSDSDRESTTGSSGEGGGSHSRHLSSLVSSLMTPTDAVRSRHRSRKHKYKEHRLLTPDEIEALPYVDEEILTTLISNYTKHDDLSKCTEDFSLMEPQPSSYCDPVENLLSKLKEVFSNPYAVAKSFQKRKQSQLPQPKSEEPPEVMQTDSLTDANTNIDTNDVISATNSSNSSTPNTIIDEKSEGATLLDKNPTSTTTNPEIATDTTTTTTDIPSDYEKKLDESKSSSSSSSKNNIVMNNYSSSSSSKYKTSPEISVDIGSVYRTFQLLSSLENDEVLKVLLTALSKMSNELSKITKELKHSSSYSMKGHLRLLNIYPIILANPLLQSPAFLDQGFPLFCQAMSQLENIDVEQLVIWFAKYSNERLSELLSNFQQLITYEVVIQTEVDENYQVQSDCIVVSAVKCLRVVYLASLLSAKQRGHVRPYKRSNKRTGDSFIDFSRVIDPISDKFKIYPNAITKPTLAFEDFYNESLNDIIDIRIDLENKLTHTSYKKFSYLRYSFCLNPATKVFKLFFDHKIQMMDERRRTFLHMSYGFDETPYLYLNVKRDSLLNDTLGNLEAISDLRPEMLKKQLRVKFDSEEGLDEGGVQKEFFMLLIEELFNLDFGMFYTLDDTDTHWFNLLSYEQDNTFKLIGILLGLAIYNSNILDIRIPTVIYSKLLNCTPTFDDLHTVQPTIAKSLQTLLDYEGDDVEDAFMLTFQICYPDPFGGEIFYDLKENGEDIPVTGDNKKEFVDLYSDWLLNKSIEPQFIAFKAGFDLVMKSSFLDEMFTAEEVQLLVCGSQDFNFNDLEKTTSYDGGYTANHPLICQFWELVHSFEESCKRRLLQFITGSDRIPVGGLSKIKMVVVRNGPDSDRLPSAHTCFNALLLPDYCTKERLRKRLLKALEYGKGFGMI